MYVYNMQEDLIGTLGILQSMSEFGGLWKHYFVLKYFRILIS